MKKILSLFTKLSLSLLIVVSLGCSTDEPYEQTQVFESQKALDAHANNRTYSTSLKGSNEVPAVNTKAAGHATVKIGQDGESIDFKITVGNIENVTQAHLHMQQSGLNGPVVAFLYGFVSDASGPVNGILAEGTITEAQLIGPLSGLPIESLMEAIDNGMIYVNVHTVQNPGGEIRGQL